MKDRHPVQLAALLAGVAFLLVGVLGFVPGITTSYSELGLVGHESEAKLLGIFQVNVLHNVVHLLFGVAGVVLARTSASAKAYLVGGGALYLVLALYGFVIDLDSAANFVSLNGADNVLHVVLGLGMLALGLVLGRGVRETASTRR